MALVAGRYDLGALLGSGGFASVYRARDTVTERDVAIKVIPFGEAAAENFERFRQEALALSRLRSRHVARVHDFGRDPSLGLYLVMELIDGVPLEAPSFGRALMPHEVLRVARGVLDALADAHAAGIVHRDIKPSNVLVPRSRGSLDDVRVLDFGIARSVRRSQVLEGLGVTETQAGVVLGTPAYMAPEQLLEQAAGPASDVYAAGLVLFDLLGLGPLHPGATLREQLTARIKDDPDVKARIPAPLGLLLGRMLMRDPAKRFPDAGEALAAIGDLETAPVVLGELLAPTLGDNTRKTSSRSDSHRPPMPSAGSLTTMTGAHTAPSGAPGPGASSGPSSAGTPAGERVSTGSGSRPPPPASRMSSRPPPLVGGRRTASSQALGNRRLFRLHEDPLIALREALQSLDIAMIDALGRRERGEDIGRIARALALALRLELDAAALILEPIALRSDVARGIGSCIVAPRARRVTRARVDPDKADPWLDTVEPELAAMLAAFGAAMTGRDDAVRAVARCKVAEARLDDKSSSTARSLRMGQLTAACLASTVQTSTALGEMVRLRDTDPQPPSMFNLVLRSLMLGAAGFRGDEHLAREHLERASRLAADSCNTLLEARAIVAWGGMLVEIPTRVEQGLSVLERATTLLAHGDAPGLEHIAEHNRGAALIIQQRFEEGAHHLHRARSAAKGELSLEHEMISCANEAFCHIFLGQYEAATRVLTDLGDERIGSISARTAGFALVARSLYGLVFQSLDIAQLELRRAMACASEAEADGGDVYLLTELLGILYASARGEPVDLLGRAGQLEKLAQDHGFASFYWFTNLRAAVAQIRDDALRDRVSDTLERLVVMLVPINHGAAGNA